jgi:predicted metalloprotease with PDZ domain
VSHEFCHAWNVEASAASLEPFNFDDVGYVGGVVDGGASVVNYGSLVLRRSGLMSVGDYTPANMHQHCQTVMTAPGRRVRSAIEMSRWRR